MGPCAGYSAAVGGSDRADDGGPHGRGFPDGGQLVYALTIPILAMSGSNICNTWSDGWQRPVLNNCNEIMAGRCCRIAPHVPQM